MIRFTGNPSERVNALRIFAHAEFDKLWKSGSMSRSAAYAWLSEQMGLSPAKTHMKLFTISQCELVIALVKNKERLGL